ncbi:hypothetical protein Tco_0228143 [Tanacetum coccineum]
MMDQEKEDTEQSDAVRKEFEAQCNKELLQGKASRASSTNSFNTVSTPVNVASAPRTFNDVGPSFVPLGGSFPLDVNNPADDPLMPDLEDTAKVQHTGIFCKADFNNMEPSTVVSPIPTTRVHSIHPKDQIIRDPRSAVQTRGMTKKSSGEHAMISYEPTKIAQALDDESWVEAMQEELLQFKIQKVWTLVNLPYGKKAIGTKISKERREMFTKVEKALYGLHQAPRAWYENRSTYLLDNGLYKGQIDKTLFIKRSKGDILLMSSIGELTFFLGLQVKQKEDGIFISQDKYVGEILKKFSFSSIRTANTPMETNKALIKDKDGEDVDVHLYSKKIFRYLKGRPNWAFVILRTLLLYWKLSQTMIMQVPAWIGNPQQEIKIYVDNESAICVVKNPVYHSKTKHIEIRHHFIRYSYEKRLIEMVKIYTD